MNQPIMKYLVLIILIVFVCESSKAQTNNTISGTVSYKSSQNVYVKFQNTSNISVGDTLFIQRDNTLIPKLIVTNLSTTSCVCTAISNENIAVSTPLVAKNRASNIADNEDINDNTDVNPQNVTDTTSTEKPNRNKLKQRISGSISATVYSKLSNTNADDSYRFHYNFSLKASNIANSKFSFETYVSFKYENSEWNLVKNNVFEALKIYTLSARYDFNKNTFISVGRRINPKISSIGAVDGLQFEKKFNNFSVGTIVGSRPNYQDYNFDISLPQLGAYVSHDFKNQVGMMQNSFALVEQMNAMKTDRRFAYLQHNNNLIKKLYFFGSAEIDLYKKIDNKAQTAFSLTNIYTLVTYRLIKQLSFSASYDNRKNVIYYETYKNFIYQMLEIESRQGVSIQTNYSSRKSISAGVRAGYRFKNANSRESKNMYAYVSYYNIPALNINTTLAATYLESSYLKGKTINLNISKELLNGKLYAECGYQMVDFLMFESSSPYIQNIADVTITWKPFKTFTFHFNIEETFENQDQYTQFKVQVRKRF